MLSERGEKEKDKYCMLSLVYGTLKKTNSPKQRRLVTRAMEGGIVGRDVGQRVQTCS